MSNSTFKPLSLALFALLSTGALSAQSVPSGILAEDGDDTPAATTVPVLVATEREGTSMGDATGITYRDSYYYDGLGHLLRLVSAGRDYKTDEFDLTKITYYIYNDKGQLTDSYFRQKGLYDIGIDKVLNPVAKDSVAYSYNEAGQLTRKDEKYFYTTYEYDANGNVVKEEKRYKTGDKIYQSQVYSKFIGKDLPTHVVSSSEQIDSYKYEENREYNQLGQLTKSEKYVISEDIDPDTELPVEVTKTIGLYKAEYYDNGVLKDYVEYIQDYYGNLAANDSIAYTPTDTPMRYMRTDYSWMNDGNGQGKWSANLGGSTVYYLYQTLAEEASTHIAVTPDPEKMNCNKVEFTFPEFALVGQYRFDLYRDGLYVESADFTDPKKFDAEKMVYTFVDDSLSNGYHDYFVRTMVGDEMGEEFTGWNISNAVTLSNYTELPSVQNLHLTDYRQKGSYYYVSFAWDDLSEEDKAKYGFKRYDVVLAGDRAADNADPEGQEGQNLYGNVNKWEIMAYNKAYTTKVDVQGYFKYGRSHAYVDVVMSDILEGISQTAANGVETSYSAHVLHLSQQSNVKVYNAAGQMVNQANGVQSLSLESQPKGTYLLLVESNGKVAVLKVVR